MMRKMFVIGACSLVVAACGDDDDDRQIVTTNSSFNNSSTTNNGSNTTTNNSTSPNGTTVGDYDGAAIMALDLGTNPVGMPCRSENVTSNNTNRVDYGYDEIGQLTIIDTYQNTTFVSRQYRKWAEGEISEIVTVDPSDETTEFVSVFNYDPEGRPSEVQRRSLTMEGELGTTFETVRFNHTSPTTWGVSVFDAGDNMIGGDSYSWEAGSLRYSIFAEDDAMSALIFTEEADVSLLRRERFLQVFELGTEIAEGFSDLNDDMVRDVEASYTYDANGLQQIEVTGDLTATRTFTYDCSE